MALNRKISDTFNEYSKDIGLMSFKDIFRLIDNLDKIENIHTRSAVCEAIYTRSYEFDHTNGLSVLDVLKRLAASPSLTENVQLMMVEKNKRYSDPPEHLVILAATNPSLTLAAQDAIASQERGRALQEKLCRNPAIFPEIQKRLLSGWGASSMAEALKDNPSLSRELVLYHADPDNFKDDAGYHTVAGVLIKSQKLPKELQQKIIDKSDPNHRYGDLAGDLAESPHLHPEIFQQLFEHSNEWITSKIRENKVAQSMLTNAKAEVGERVFEKLGM